MTEVRSYETRGGIGVECSIEPVAGQAALDALTAAARRASRRAARVELRVPRSLHALGHGLRRSGVGAGGARAQRRDRSAERARRRAVAADRARARGSRRDRELRRGRDVAALQRARTRGPLPRGGTQSPAFRVLGAARAGGPLRIGRRSAPRALRRLRLRPRLPVRAAAPAARAARAPARPGALPARRAAGRRPSPRGRDAAPLRVPQRRRRDARAAAHGRRDALHGSRRDRTSRATTRPASTPASCAARRSRSGAAISSRWCPARLSSSRRSIRPPPSSVGCGAATRRPMASS